MMNYYIDFTHILLTAMVTEISGADPEHNDITKCVIFIGAFKLSYKETERKPSP